MSKSSLSLKELVEWLILAMFLGCVLQMHAQTLTIPAQPSQRYDGCNTHTRISEDVELVTAVYCGKQNPLLLAKQTNPTEQEFKNSTPSFGVRLLKKADKVDWSPKAQAEADKVYDSTLAVIQREHIGKDIKPQFILVIGTEKDEMILGEPEDARLPRIAEIHLKKWDPYKFAQGVIKAYCFELIDRQEVLRLANRATAWANASVDVGDLKR